MALRSFDSQTRLGIPRPTKSERAAYSASYDARYQVEQYADEGTLILEPAPISVAPSSFAPSCVTIPPPPPSSVRPPMPSWDDRSGWVPVSNASEVTASTRVPPKASASASAMVLMAAAAALAALVSIGFMNKANRGSDAETAAAAQAAADPAPLAAPITPPIAPPVPVPAIDIDDVKPVPAAAPKPVVAAAPVVNTPSVQTPTAQPPAKPAKEKAPASAAQQKALEDLLEQLGEEQLKR